MEEVPRMRRQGLSRFRYQVVFSPALPPGAGHKATEVEAATVEEADAKVRARTQDWLQRWADEQKTAYEWKYMRGTTVVASGTVQPNREPT